MTSMPSTRTIVVLALAALALAVGVASVVQRNAARTGAQQTATGKAMLEAMLDEETGVRGFALTSGRAEEFLEPYQNGEERFLANLAMAYNQTRGDTAAREALARSALAAQRWRGLSDNALIQVRAGRVRTAYALTSMRRRKEAMDRFRLTNARYLAATRARAHRLESRAVVLSVSLVVVLGGAFALGGMVLARRAGAGRAAARAAERDFEQRQRELNFGLQVTESEEEAQSFLHRHLEHAIPGSEVVVLKRNNSANRLLPGTPLDPGSKLEGAFTETEPRSCLAVRLAQRRSHAADQSTAVMACGICGKLETETTCSPLLVGGEVIGSVLVGHPGPLDDLGERALEESVKQAAPVLANLRNLAIAERRAATDGLTGLPNRRAFEETLKRMSAHANRTMSPLAAVALDLDHFKQINDVYGHGQGDEVLAAVGALLLAVVRESDFVARVGGEEFMILLPDTGRDGSLIICERIRAGIAGLEFPAMGQDVTASLGVAVLPDDEVDAPSLVRAADRMLYTAKTNGRNRVEIAELDLGALPDGEGAAIA